MNGGDRTTEAFLTYRENFSRYRDTVLECLSDALYRYRRYEVEFGAMLLYAETPFKPENYRDLVRQTDRIHLLEEHFLLVTFDHAEPENAIKAAQNFLHAFLSRDLRQVVYAAAAPIEEGDETAIDIASRLFIILEHAIRHNHYNCIVDMGQMKM